MLTLRAHLLREALMNLIWKLGHLGLLAVGVAAGAGHLDPVALQDGRLCSGKEHGEERR